MHTHILSNTAAKQFQKTVYHYFGEHGRTLPWRDETDPYRILISEIMLQQTQVQRVIEKYRAFISAFPSVKDLAAAPLDRVLTLWSGLGYNRRALQLKKMAEHITIHFKGIVPDTQEELQQMPGIGPATASAIVVFAFNKAALYLETNVRSVFIHHFFADREAVHDREILPLIEQTLDYNNPRKWFSALLDYGVFLKKQEVNPSRKSTHYSRQSPFEGSNRQVRGLILKQCIDRKRTSKRELTRALEKPADVVKINLDNLIKEGLIEKKNGYFSLKK